MSDGPPWFRKALPRSWGCEMRRQHPRRASSETQTSIHHESRNPISIRIGRALCGPPSPAPPASSSLLSCPSLSWLHPLKVWGLRQTRGGSLASAVKVYADAIGWDGRDPQLGPLLGLRTVLAVDRQGWLRLHAEATCHWGSCLRAVAASYRQAGWPSRTTID